MMHEKRGENIQEPFNHSVQTAGWASKYNFDDRLNIQVISASGQFACYLSSSSLSNQNF